MRNNVCLTLGHAPAAPARRAHLPPPPARLGPAGTALCTA